MIIRNAKIKDIDQMLLLLKQLGYEQSKSIFVENLIFLQHKMDITYLLQKLIWKLWV